MSQSAPKCLVGIHTQPQSRIRLFCLAHAGGGASFFRSWKEHLRPIADVYAIQLPGREMRMNEAPKEVLPELLQELARDLLPYLNKPFAFFGHSLGALLAYELTHHLRQFYRLQPDHLFVSSFRAPHLPQERAPIHHLPDDEFLHAMFDMGGTSDDVMSRPELLELFLPMLRADFKLAEVYSHQRKLRLSVPVTAFMGEHDTISKEMLLAWPEHTSGHFRHHVLPGGHFYMKERDNEAQLVKLIQQDLQLAVERQGRFV